MPAATTPLFHLGSQLFFPAALLVAVLGQRLWGLRLAVSRTLVWSLLTALLIAAYVLLVGLSSLLDARRRRQRRNASPSPPSWPPRSGRCGDSCNAGSTTSSTARRASRCGMVDRIGRGIDASGTPTELLVGVLDDLVTSLRLSGATIDVNDAGRRGHRGDDRRRRPATTSWCCRSCSTSSWSAR